jgi:hypothetical protein
LSIISAIDWLTVITASAFLINSFSNSRPILYRNFFLPFECIESDHNSWLS